MSPARSRFIPAFAGRLARTGVLCGLSAAARAEGACEAGVCALTLWHPDHADGVTRVPRERFALDGEPPWVDLGDSWSDAELAFELAPGVAIESVEAQVSYSLTIGADGPHLDLVALNPVWTPRFPTTSAVDGRYALAVPPLPADPGFTASKRQVRRAIRAWVESQWEPEHVREEARFWTDLAATCPDWRSNPCGVTEAILRVYVTTSAGERVIDVMIPQGC